LARDDYFIGGFSLVGLNRFCNPTTALLIIITILIFIFILILSILIILIIIPIILIILIILFVLIIVVISSFLLPSLSSSSVSFIVLVSNLINIKRLALFVTCSNSKKTRETVAAFRLHLANPPLRLPPYPRPASFRTSSLAVVLVVVVVVVAGGGGVVVVVVVVGGGVVVVGVVVVVVAVAAAAAVVVVAEGSLEVKLPTNMDR